MLVEANKIDPKLHNDSYLHLKEMLGLKEVEAPVINNGDKKRKNKKNFPKNSGKIFIFGQPIPDQIRLIRQMIRLASRKPFCR